MKQCVRVTRTWWLALAMIPLLAVAAGAGPSEANLVGNAAQGAGTGAVRDSETVDSTAWSSTGAKGAAQKNINKGALSYQWTSTTVGNAKALLDAKAASDPVLKDKLNRIVGQRMPGDLHPVEYAEWLKLQADKDLGFLRPPPNKIQIVDQEALAKMDKSKISVKYKKTTICPRVITYKPVYKTITVYYPG